MDMHTILVGRCEIGRPKSKRSLYDNH